MERFNRVVVVALLVALATALHAPVLCADDGVFLAYGFHEGYSQEYKVKFNQEVDFGGFAMSQMIDMEVTEQCVGSEDSLFLMQLVFDKVEAARVQFEKMSDDPMGEKLTGHTVTFKVDAHGETSEIRPMGYIEGWEQMGKVVESLVENWYAYLPVENVSKGAGWTKEDQPDEEETVKVHGTTEFVFDDVKKEKGRECAKIKAKVENEVGGTQDTPAGTMTVSGTGEGDVEFYFCMKSSTIVKYKADIEMKMDMTPEAGGDANKTTVAMSMERELK